ncbi:MAG: ATP-dependent helicase [Actinomycetota bacterium]|nr:ATP-dependent helicase [Actinomycetota bacterium]
MTPTVVLRVSARADRVEHMSSGTTYQLVASAPAPIPPPQLDEDQLRVVRHPGGPLLVLAGPGTGKTTTLVEAIVDRIHRGADPGSVLALTFSRKAAEQLRDRVTGRLGETTSGALSSTFHSFAYGLVRAYSPRDLYLEPLQLLSAAEQDVLIRGLLTGEAESVRWPHSLAAAVGTRGFAHEVAAVLSRTTERGLGSMRLRELGIKHDRPELVAAAAFIEQYDAVLTNENRLDYASLIGEAVRMLQDPDHPARSDLRARFAHVFVDEYQDTDPSQVALLKAIAGDGRNLVVVGDPHQSIYAFRGADVRGILEFPSMFPTAAGTPAPVEVLRTTRRFGPRILTATQRVAARIGLHGSIDSERLRAFLDPGYDEQVDPGRVQVLTFDTARAETEGIADLLRRAHLEDGVGWSQMAVLVRSGRNSIPGLRRALMTAGVPIEVAADETPLVREPALLPLLDALRAAADPDWLDPDRAHALLISQLVGLDATDVRALGRELRIRERAADQVSGVAARSSGELLLEAVRDASALHGVRAPAARRARTLPRLLDRARTMLDGGRTAEEVLWELWSGTPWPKRLRAAVDRGGAAARLAHRDLDAVVALFEAAARAEDQRGHTSVLAFLDTLQAQQIPADTLAERGVRGEAVRLLTAHRSKGLEWPLVVVAHVQEESWPDLRLRTTLLGADELGSDGLQRRATTRELLAEERRLFYVACTRAGRRMIVSAVRSPDDDGEQPSRFLGELGVDVCHHQGRPSRPMSLDGVVAELRRTLADPAAPEPLRQAAARRLAALRAERLGDRALVPAADPASWWGTRPPSVSETPVRPADEPLRLSASALTALQECPTRWFFESEAGGQRAGTQSTGFGNVVHALADRIGRGELSADPEALDELMAYVDQVWAEIPFRTPWSAAQERVEARNALARLLAHLARDDARVLLATEHELSATVSLPDGERITLRGKADRLELDEQGRVVVIDLKTTKYPPRDIELGENPQLGMYQLAVEAGAVDDLLDGPGVPGGAELWQLRRALRTGLKVQPQQPLAVGGERPVEEQLASAAAQIRAELFWTRPQRDVCLRCDFKTMCPAQSSGTVLS